MSLYLNASVMFGLLRPKKYSSKLLFSIFAIAMYLKMLVEILNMMDIAITPNLCKLLQNHVFMQTPWPPSYNK